MVKRKKPPVKEEPKLDRGKIILAVVVVGMLGYAVAVILQYVFISLKGGGDPSSQIIPSVIGILVAVIKFMLDTKE